MIKAVIFDIDNTLYNFDRAHERAIDALSVYTERELGISRAELTSLNAEILSACRESMGDVAAIHNRTIRFQYILEQKGLPLHPHVLEMDRIYWDTLIEAAEISEGALETLRFLKEQKIRTGIGTDMTARVQFRKLTKLGLLPYIDFFVSSEEAGVEKPHPDFFAQCVKKAGCQAEECLFIGDSLKKDAQGAIDAGLRALWYCPEGRREDVDVPQIENMGEVPRILSKMCIRDVISTVLKE